MANFAGFLKKAFPLIHAALSFGGPLGTGVANMIGDALKLSSAPDPTPEAVGEVVVTATQDQINALKQIEADLQVKLASLNVQSADDLLGLDNEDRANARARQISLKDKTPTYLAWFITFGFFGILIMVARYGVAPSVHDLVVSLIGALSLAWGAIVTYFYGSSAGSARKTEILANGSK